MPLPVFLSRLFSTSAGEPQGHPSRRLASALVAASMSLMLVACDGAAEREAAYFERGKALYEDGDYTKAQLEFKNARQINPLNMQALYYLALISEKRGKYQRALRAFLKVLQQEPNHIGANIHAGRMQLASGEFDDALVRTERVLAQEPNNADALALRAALHLRRDSLADARKDAAMALQQDPDNLGANAVIAGIFQKENKPKEAIKVLEYAIGKNPKDISLRMLLIEMLRQQKNIGAIEKVYGDLFKLQPRNHDYRVSLARILINADRKDAAEQVLRDGIKLNPNDIRAKLILVDFQANQRKFEDAEATLKALIAKSPELNVLRFSLSQLYVRHKKSDQAEEILQQIADTSKSNPDVVRARTGIARLRLADGDVDGAMTLLTDILSEDSSNGDALTTRGRIHLQRGNISDAIADLRNVLRDKPDATEALSLLADAHLRAREVDLAGESLRLLLMADPANDTARLRLARIYAGQRNYDKALALTSQVLGRTPKSDQALRMKGEILLAQGNLVPALTAAEQFREATGDAVAGNVSVGRVHQAAGRHEKAITAFQGALDHDKNSGPALTGLVRSLIATERSGDAVDYLKQLIKKSPDNVYAHNLLGEVYAVDKVASKAEKSFLEAASIRSSWPLPYINLGRLMVAQNEPTRAVAILKKGVMQAPTDTTLQLSLAAAQQAAMQYEAAIKTYRSLLTRNPSLDAAANNIAAIIADRKFEDKTSLDDALKLAQRFQVSENPYYLDTLGWVHYRRGDYNLAIVFLKRAVDELPNHPVLNYHLAMAYYKGGQKEEARRHLEKAVAKDANYPQIDEARVLLQSM